MKKLLATLLIVVSLTIAAVGGATVKLYTATAEDYANEVESQDIAKLRARDKAIKKATKQAGVYLKTYSRSVNSELTDDEVTAITSNAWQLVSEPKYNKTLKQISDETMIIVWTATVEVNVDDSEIQSWIKRDDKDKSAIISQTQEAQKLSEENDKKIEDLREQYNRATSQADKDKIREQINDADRDFLANQKLEEANKLYYAKDYQGAINSYNDVLKLKPDWSWAYNNRGAAYNGLGQYERAVQDFNKAIEFNPNNFLAYFNRGLYYYDKQQYERAIQDYNKAIKVNPNFYQAYNNRGEVYRNLGQYEQAIKDYTEAILLNPRLEEPYNNRGAAYNESGQYERAVKDCDEAIALNPKSFEAYTNRGFAYQCLKQYERALQDYNKALSIIEHPVIYCNRGETYYYLKDYKQAFSDLNKAIELGIDGEALGETLYYRGLCYQATGNNEKAQSDLQKAKELGYNG